MGQYRGFGHSGRRCGSAVGETVVVQCGCPLVASGVRRLRGSSPSLGLRRSGPASALLHSRRRFTGSWRSGRLGYRERGPADPRVPRRRLDVHPPPEGSAWNVAITPDAQDLICHHDLAPWNLVRGAGRFAFIDRDRGSGTLPMPPMASPRSRRGTAANGQRPRTGSGFWPMAMGWTARGARLWSRCSLRGSTRCTSFWRVDPRRAPSSGGCFGARGMERLGWTTTSSPRRGSSTGGTRSAKARRDRGVRHCFEHRSSAFGAWPASAEKERPQIGA